MSIAGSAIHVVLRMNGADVEHVAVHPNLLDGPYTINSRRYQVRERRLERYAGPIRPTNGTSMPMYYYPDWVVVIDLDE